MDQRVRRKTKKKRDYVYACVSMCGVALLCVCFSCRGKLKWKVDVNVTSFLSSFLLSFSLRYRMQREKGYSASS